MRVSGKPDRTEGPRTARGRKAVTARPRSGPGSHSRDLVRVPTPEWEAIAGRAQSATEIDPSTGCWVWQLGVSNGYGNWGGGRRAHRVVYEAVFGPVPDGLVLDHLCSNKLCCNPSHLEPVTSGENIRRAAPKLDRAKALQIRRSAERGVVLARRFGVSQALVSRVRSGERWAA